LNNPTTKQTASMKDHAASVMLKIIKIHIVGHFRFLHITSNLNLALS